MECKDRNNRSAIMLPYSYLPSMASKELRDAADKVCIIWNPVENFTLRSFSRLDWYNFQDVNFLSCCGDNMNIYTLYVLLIIYWIRLWINFTVYNLMIFKPIWAVCHLISTQTFNLYLYFIILYFILFFDWFNLSVLQALCSFMLII